MSDRSRFPLGALGIVVLSASFFIQPGRSQSIGITSQITSQKHAPPTMGRDFWFAIPSNFWGQDLGGKYLQISITSQRNTVAHIGLGTNEVDSIPVKAYAVSTYQIPLNGWEMETSGDVENRGVHVWSTGAELTVYFMSHNSETSDGTYIIPTIGCGTDYVIAGFQALFEGSSDLPSEFTIASGMDNTNVDITPSTDLRSTTNASATAHAAGQTFRLTLNRGQSVQFMSVQAQSSSDMDVTGTVIHSSNPIGVIGGSMCTNIPIDFPYCDHVEHMLPPLRIWGQTYYATNFAQPAGTAGHNSGMYLFVSSKPNQTIWGFSTAIGTHQECVIPSQYGIYWDELQNAQKFWSDAPFMLVEYINSSSYPDNHNANGDPAEVVVPSREQFSRDPIFETPIAKGSQQPYDNYLNIIVNVKDEPYTTFDGKNILSYTHQPIDDTFEIFLVPKIQPGAHPIQGDSLGVGIYGYGYGFDESYAWSGPLGIATYQSPDTVGPVAQITSTCFSSHVHLSDSGSANGPQSHLSFIRVDSQYNMTFQLDSNWIEGVGFDTSGYNVSVIDGSNPGYLSVDVFDLAGNRTTIVSTYEPDLDTVVPAVQDVGNVPADTVRVVYDTLVNPTASAFAFQTLKLVKGDVGFTLDSVPASPIPPGQKALIKIKFQDTSVFAVSDTILFGDECRIVEATLIANAARDFYVDNQAWLPVPLTKDTGWIAKPVLIHNLSNTEAIHVLFDSVSDPVHFGLAPFQASTLTVPNRTGQPGSGLDSIWFIYEPTDSLAKTAVAYWHSPQVLASDGITPLLRTDTLRGIAASTNMEVLGQKSFHFSIVSDLVFGPEATFEYSNSEECRVTLQIFDALGREVLRPVSDAWRAPGSWTITCEISGLPPGTYTYRVQVLGADENRLVSKEFEVLR